MNSILIILKKLPQVICLFTAAPLLLLFSIIFKHVDWYTQQFSGERLQDHWSSGFLCQPDGYRLSRWERASNKELVILLFMCVCF